MKKLLLIIWLLCLGICHVAAIGVQPSDSTIVLNGTVKDAHTQRPLANVNVYVDGKDMGVMTNGDGVFSLKISREEAEGKILFSSLGYANGTRTIREMSGNEESVIYLTPASRVLDEVTVYGGDAKGLVREAIQRIDANYSLQASLLHMFYRETIMKGSRFVGISEGIMDVFKDSYRKRSVAKDRVRMKRGRKLLSQKTRDTLAVKIQGGPMLALYLDLAKDGGPIFCDEALSLYSFRHEQVEMLDNRLHFVVSFKPIVVMDDPLYSGLLYIDSQSLCLTRAELSLDVSDVDKANKTVLLKRPIGLRFKCKESSFVVAYRLHGDRSCLDYVKNTIRFKCDWKRRLFSSAYTATAEMVTVDVEKDATAPIPLSESYSKRHLFSDEARRDWDQDFWKDYNIIEPTESLEKAVKRLNKNNKVQ